MREVLLAWLNLIFIRSHLMNIIFQKNIKSKIKIKTFSMKELPILNKLLIKYKWDWLKLMCLNKKKITQIMFYYNYLILTVINR